MENEFEIGLRFNYNRREAETWLEKFMYLEFFPAPSRSQIR